MNDSTSASGDGRVDAADAPAKMPHAGGTAPQELGPHPAVWTFVALVHAFVFVLVGVYVPWDPWAPFAISCHALAALHLVSATTTWLGTSPRGVTIRRASRRAVAVASLVHLGGMTIVIARGMALLVEVYGDLGRGLAAAIAAAFCVEVLFTLPLGCWSWALSRPPRETPSTPSPRAKARTTALSGAGLVLLASAATFEPALRIRSTPAPRPALTGGWNGGESGGQSEAHALQRLTASRPRSPRALAALERVVRRDATCANPLDTPGLATVFVAFAARSIPTSPDASPTSATPDTEKKDPDGARRAEPHHLCVQAAPAEVFDALDAALVEREVPLPIRVDVVDSVRTLPTLDALVRPFALRPGLDGLCIGSSCTTPWQLAARRAFISLTPVPTIPDLRMGVDLRRFVGERTADVTTFSTRAYLVEADGDVVPMSRLVAAPGDAFAASDTEEEHEEAVESAIEGATAHIVRAQRGDGRFRYMIDPFRARRSDDGVNLPRQAGTTLVLCELADDDHLSTMRHALGYMASQAIDSGEVTALVKHERRESEEHEDDDDETDDDDEADDEADTLAPAPLPAVADLGSTALPAIAFLACRDRAGPRHDELVVRMVRFLLAMQLPDGTFHPKWDVRAAAPKPGPHPLFAEGQAVYALGLAERLARERPELGLDAVELHDAVERSLDHFSRAYWPRVLRDFFFVEENWHCLAARALLESHRHDDYERFCLDYVRFKRRLLLHEHDRVHPDFVGGYGFGNVVPPQSTPTAGLGEALAAAISIARARGEDTSEMEADLRLVHTFLLRQQIRRERCFGCRNLGELDGGFSESMVSPGLRIDFTQHALAALGHGRDVLEPHGE